MAITPTTEQLQIDNESLLRVEYGDTWDKKYRDKGQAQQSISTVSSSQSTLSRGSPHE